MNANIKIDFARLRAEGLSQRAIARQLGVSRGTCARMAREMEAAIAEYSLTASVATMEAYRLSWASRVSQLDELLLCLEDEILNRDFSDVDTARLIYLFVAAQRQRAAMDATGDLEASREPLIINFVDDYGDDQKAISGPFSADNSASSSLPIP